MFNRSRIVPVLTALALVVTLTSHAQQILSPAQAKGKKILLVVGEPEKGETNDDELVKKHLEEQGYVVTMAKEDDPANKAGGRGSRNPLVYRGSAGDWR